MQIIKDDTGVIVGFVGESGMSRYSKDMLEEAIKNNEGFNFVDRKGTKIEILPFYSPKEYHHVVIARSGAGMTVHTKDTMYKKPIMSKKHPDYRKFEKNKRF